MKINRLIEITILLLNKRNIKASELAERFDVSVRTIYRDIEVLSASGIPVYATQGANGGISIMDHYTINRTVISENESDNIIFALQSLAAIQYPDINKTLEKMAAVFKSPQNDWITVDFTPWGSDPNEYGKFNKIKESILGCHVLEIDYINAANIKTYRKISPLKLIFKSRSWYIWGFCHWRSEYRTFKISRIKNTRITAETFNRTHMLTIVEEKEEKIIIPPEPVIIRFTEGALYRLYDDYDDSMLIRNEDGTYTLELLFPVDEWLFGYILSFGSEAEVIHPIEVCMEVKRRAASILKKYEK